MRSYIVIIHIVYLSLSTTNAEIGLLTTISVETFPKASIVFLTYNNNMLPYYYDMDRCVGNKVVPKIFFVYIG